MAVAIKRIVQFGYSKMNSVQSEQMRIRAKNKYRNEHIKEEYKKFNIRVLDNTEGLTYNQYYKKYCKRGKQINKDELDEKDFYLARLYTGKNNNGKKESGRETTCVETMVISLNDRVEATPEAILAYQKDPENRKKMQAFTDYITKTDERFKNCRFLNIDWHFDEVYSPYERLEPTAEFPDGELVIGKPRISVHCHVTYIPLIKEVTSKGNEYYCHNRGAVWRSRTDRFNQSYSQFNDDIYEAVEKNFGYERGELSAVSKEDRKDMNIQDFILDNNQKMEHEYMMQRNLALKIEEEKTARAKGELTAEQEKRKAEGEKIIKKLESEIKDQEEYNSALRIESSNLEKTIDERRMKTTVLKKQLSEVEFKLDGMKKDIEKKIQENTKLDKDIDEKMKEYNELHASIEEAIKNLNQKKAKKEAELAKKRIEVDEEMNKLEQFKEAAIRQQNIRKRDEQEALQKSQEALQKSQNATREVKIFAQIELALARHEMSKEEAMQTIWDMNLDDQIQAFRDEKSRFNTPNLHKLSRNFGDDPR